MKINLSTVNRTNAGVINLRCPHCGNEGSFEKPLQDIHDLIATNSESLHYQLGIRRCPNPRCNGQVFFIQNNLNKYLETFPPIRLDFESEGVPEKIKETFEEALTCHSNKCYIASAIMIRRTLEEICYERQATGNNLKSKISSLRNKVILPQELLDAADELRLLGNDAAHIESNVFVGITEKETTISILLTKEIIKAIYQYKGLLAELQNLKNV